MFRSEDNWLWYLDGCIGVVVIALVVSAIGGLLWWLFLA